MICGMSLFIEQYHNRFAVVNTLSKFELFVSIFCVHSCGVSSAKVSVLECS